MKKLYRILALFLIGILWYSNIDIVNASDEYIYTTSTTIIHSHGEQDKSSCYKAIKCSGYGTSMPDYGSGDLHEGNAMAQCNSCGKYWGCDGTPWGTTMNCDNILRYELNCSKANTQLGIVRFNVDGNLNASVNIENSKVTNVTYLWSTGERTSSIVLPGVGTYTCKVSYTDPYSKLTLSKTFSYTLEDTESPIINNVIYDTVRAKHIELIIEATDNIGVASYMITKEAN